MRQIRFALVLLLTLILPATAAESVEISSPKSSQTFGGGAGGKKTLIGDCQPGQALVGVSINTYFGVSIWCNLLSDDGTSAGSNNPMSSVQFLIYGNTNKNIFCPAGEVATTIRVQSNGYASGLGLICNEPPNFTKQEFTTSTISGQGNWKNISCVDGFLTGIWVVVGDWIDRIGARCSTLASFSISYDANQGDVPAPNKEIIFDTNRKFSLASEYTGKRVGLTFVGWNTAPDGTGNHFDPGASLTISKNLKLYAEWRTLQANFEFQKSDSNSNPKLNLTNLQIGQKIRIRVRSGR